MYSFFIFSIYLYFLKLKFINSFKFTDKNLISKDINNLNGHSRIRFLNKEKNSNLFGRCNPNEDLFAQKKRYLQNRIKKYGKDCIEKELAEAIYDMIEEDFHDFLDNSTEAIQEYNQKKYKAKEVSSCESSHVYCSESSENSIDCDLNNQNAYHRREKNKRLYDSKIKRRPCSLKPIKAVPLFVKKKNYMINPYQSKIKAIPICHYNDAMAYEGKEARKCIINNTIKSRKSKEQNKKYKIVGKAYPIYNKKVNIPYSKQKKRETRKNYMCFNPTIKPGHNNKCSTGFNKRNFYNHAKDNKNFSKYKNMISERNYNFKPNLSKLENIGGKPCYSPNYLRNIPKVLSHKKFPRCKIQRQKIRKNKDCINQNDCYRLKHQNNIQKPRMANQNRPVENHIVLSCVPICHNIVQPQNQTKQELSYVEFHPEAYNMCSKLPSDHIEVPCVAKCIV